MTKVSIIVPCRNEGSFIDSFLKSVLDQKNQELISEILIADGMSTDGTKEKIIDASLRDGRIKLIPNEGKIVSTGLNRAISQASSEYIIRMDVHTIYSADYITNSVNVLIKTGAANVGGAWRAVGRTYLEKAIASAFQSPFSSGGALSHCIDYEGTVDSVYLGCWKRDTLLEFEGFDNNLVRNQDDELNLRLIKAGCTIWQSKEIISQYRPRGDYRSLFKQYFQYGYWKTYVMKKHRIPAKLRHLIPPSALVLMFVALALGTFLPQLHYALKLQIAIYIALNLSFSVFAAIKSRSPDLFPAIFIAFPIFHLSYALGLLAGFLTLFRRSSPFVTNISR